MVATRVWGVGTVTKRVMMGAAPARRLGYVVQSNVRDVECGAIDVVLIIRAVVYHGLLSTVSDVSAFTMASLIRHLPLTFAVVISSLR